MDVNDIAMVAHQVNKAYCEALGDESQVAWGNAPEWQRFSAINGVEYHVNNPDALASHSHDCWMKEKIDAGWVFGEVKDAENKTHPCIVPFDDLPIEQKAKDFIFKTVVESLRNYLD